jgi:hypothetical protein
MKIIFSIIISLVFLLNICHAQEDISWPTSNESSDKSKIGIPNGFIQIYSERNKKLKENIYKLTFFNQDSEIDTVIVLSLNKNLRLNCYAENKIHLVFDFGKTTEIVTVDITTKQITKIEANINWGLPEKVYVLGDFLFYDLPNTSYIHILNWKTGLQRRENLEVDEIKNVKIKSINLVENKDVIIINIYGIEKYVKSNFIITYDYTSNQKLFKKISDTQHLLTNIHAFYDKKEKKYIINGSYTNSQEKKPIGVFIGAINDSKNIELLKFYTYKEINNFQNHIDPKLKIDKNGYDIISHSIKEYDGTYFFLGEGYIPNYSITGGNIHSGGGISSISDYSKTHLFIIKTTIKGDIVWSHSFEMKPTYRFDKLLINTKGKIDSNGTIILNFPNGSFLETKEITNTGNIIE